MESQSNTTATYNNLEPTLTSIQYGGTSISTFDTVAIRKHDHGYDQRNLGRWTWNKIIGKAEATTVLISAYCPCISYGPSSVYSQHLRAMDNMTLPITVNNPRKLFWHDLSNFITDLNDKGFRIILSGDFNSEHTDVIEWMIQHGLVDLICEKHGYDDAPKTNITSKDSPIDGIYGSPLFTIDKGGFLSFSTLGGTHRGLWVDIPEILLFGFNPPTPSLQYAR